MAVRLAQLQAMATLDASKYDAGARQVDTANKQMQQGQAAVGQTMTQTQSRAADTARAFDKYRQSLDLTYRSQQQLELGQRRITQAYERGQITLAEQNRLLDQLNRKYAQVGQAQGGLQNSVNGMTAAYGNLRIMIGAVAGAFVVREYVQFADTMSTVAARLKIVAGGAAEAAKAEAELLAIAQRTRTEFEANVTLYARVARSRQELHLSEQQLLDTTELVQKGLKLSGASTAEASSTVIQLSQAFASGYLRGAELNSVLESGGRVALALAEGLKVPIGALKQMGEQGKLTSDVVIKALLSQKDAIDREFKSLPLTVGDALTSVRNDMLAFVGEIDKSSGLSKQLAGEVKSLGQVLKDPDVIEAGVTVVKGLAAAFTLVSTGIAGVIKALKDLAGLSVWSDIDKGLGAFATMGANALSLGPYRDPTKARGLFDTISSGIAADAGAGAKAAAPRGTIASVRVTSDQSTINALQADLNRQLEEEKKKREEIAKREAEDARRRAVRYKEYEQDLRDGVRLAGMTADEREREQAVLRAIDIANGKISETDQERIRAIVAQRQEVEKQQQALEEQKKKAEEWVREVTDFAADGIAMIFERGSAGAKQWLSQIKSWFFKLLADLAAKALVTPIIVPVVTSVLGAGAGASLAGAFGGGGGSLGGLGSTLSGGIDWLGNALGLQSAGGAGGGALAGGAGNLLGNTGLFGTATSLSGALGGGLAGVGIGSTVGALTGGNQIGSSIGGLVGGVAGSFFGPIGTAIGSALGGLVGGLIGPGPSNNAGIATFDKYGGFSVGGDEASDKTRAAVGQAAGSIQGAIAVLEAGGDVTLTKQLSRIAVGERDKSIYQFEGDDKLYRSKSVGDPAELALAVVKALTASAEFKNADLQQVLKGNSFSSVEELTNAVKFTRDVYSVIANAERPLTQVEQEMKTLTDNFAAARKQAEQLGLSLEKFDAGAAKTFDQTIADQIKAITDPVGLALDQFERGAAARVETAKKLGADLVEVEKLNGLERAAVLKQSSTQSYSGLRSLIDEIAFGASSAAAPEQQYFSALSRYNTARRDAVDTSSPEAIAEFESSARALLPVARSFLGTSQQYGALESNIVDTARTLGGSYADPAQIGAAIVTATNASGAAIVDQIKQLQDTIKELNDIIARQNAQIQALLARAA